MSTDPINIAGAIPAWTVGDRIRKARKAAGLEQDELAERLDVSSKSVGRWERDETNPSRRTLVTIAFATGVPFAWLSTGTENGGGPGPNGTGTSETYAPWDLNPEPADSVISLTTWRDAADSQAAA